MLAFRVLAYYNLERLTNKVGYGYRPYDPQRKRQTAIVRWQDRLNSGLLAPKPGEQREKKTPQDALRPRPQP